MKIEIGGVADKAAPREDYLQVDAFGAPAVRGDLRALPFAPQSLDEVFASHVFEHLPDAAVLPALAECRRVLRIGGRLEIFVPDFIWHVRQFMKADLPTRWGLHHTFIWGSQENEGQFHRTAFSVQRLAMCLQAAGFRTVDVKRRRRKERQFGDFKPVEVWGVASP